METASVGRRPFRGKKMTEEYKEYTLQLLYCDSKRLIKRLGNQKLLFNDLLNTDNLEMVDRELKTLDELYNEFIAVYAEIREIADLSSPDLIKLAVAVDQEDNDVFKIKKEASVWMINQAEGVDSRSRLSRRSKRVRGDRSVISGRSERSGSLRSNISDHSDSSESISARSEYSVKSNVSGISKVSRRAKVAGLKAEISTLEKEGVAEIEAQAEALKIAAEKFKEEQKLALSEEIEKKKKRIEMEEKDDDMIYPFGDNEQIGVNEMYVNPTGNIDNVISEIKNTTRGLVLTQKKEGKGKRRRKKSRSKLEKHLEDGCMVKENIAASPENRLEFLTQSMMKMMKSQSAPKVEIDVFGGDVLEYSYFISNFKDMIESSVEDQRGRLNRLIKYTKGEAKELIRHCIHNNPDNCYDDAMALLNKEYGGPLRISCAYMEKLKSWEVIKHGDGSSLKALYRFLLQCQAYQRAGYLTGLDSPLEIRNVQLKLPLNLQDKWTHTVSKIRRHQLKEASFSDFVKFIETEASVLNDPIYSRNARSERDGIGVKGIKTLYTENVKEDANKQKPPLHQQNSIEAAGHGIPQGKQFVSCIICKTQHDLDKCPEFLKKPYKERHKFVFDNRLCFKCYGRNHRAQECTQSKTCEECSKNHPTSLHIFRVAAVRADGAGMCVVPVVVSHNHFPEKQVLVYAMLDECSQGTFIDEKILSEEFELVQKINTSISTKTLNGDMTTPSYAAKGFTVKSIRCHDVDEDVDLPTVYSRTELPLDKSDIPSQDYIMKWKHLQHIAQSFLDKDDDVPIGLLIGRNCPKAIEPLEVIPSQGNGPYAYKTRLGWCVGSLAENNNTDTIKVNLNRLCWPANDVATGMPSALCFSLKSSNISDHGIKERLKDTWDHDVWEDEGEKRALSIEDNRFLDIMKNGVKFLDGHYQLPLPFRNEFPKLLYNREYAVKRAHGIRRKMLKNQKFHDEYVSFVMNLVQCGYARRVSKSDLQKEDGWWLPHHGVYHPTKGKLRVVMDCSAEFGGTSLNKELLQGPDLMNHMIGVFLRFRKEKVAVIGDLECMYYQVRVPEDQRKFLRFVFWEDGDINANLVDYEMCVHVFGGLSSMGCVNFALLRTADDNKEEYGAEAAEVLKKDFYVDDMAKSVANDVEAINLIKNVIEMCKAGGFNLTKIMCSSAAVMRTVPAEKCASSYKNENVQLPIIEKPLGVQWTLENDTLGFRITLESGVLSRRGMLKSISSIFDLLGIGAPFLLKGRKILQRITGDKASWDDEVGGEYVREWNAWREDLVLLQKLSFPRCYKPSTFGSVKDVSLHVFGDGCNVGYGVACYLRQVDEHGSVAVSLVMGKSRVSPLKPITIPRLELSASALAVKLGAFVFDEMGLKKDSKKYYYTDSKVVLGYICNDTKRFRVFVANRAQKIRAYSAKEEWAYVNTKDNPADDASRGLSMKQSEKVQRWLKGPDFLYRKVEDWDVSDVSVITSDDDPEVVKSVHICQVTNDLSLLALLEERISRWTKMVRVMAMMLLFIKKIRKSLDLSSPDKLTVEDLKEAESSIIKMAQQRSFTNELEELHKCGGDKSIKKSKANLQKIWKLNPFTDQKGILRVGGRLRYAGEFNTSVKFPIIMPKKAIVSERIIEHYHRMVQHGGRNSSTNEIRSSGFWVIGISSRVKSIIHNCVRCKILRGSLGIQKMSDLPVDRISSAAPFTYCGVDMFGPYNVKEGRKQLKRYCALFTCLPSRAVHVEVTASMSTDSFIQALRRFISRRGAVRVMRSDNGGNFVGVENEMKEAWKEMDHSKISDFLAEKNCDWVDWIEWQKIAPAASHMGGAWERQIGTVKRVLDSMLKYPDRLLDHESFCTLLTEVEAIVNSRPLTLEDINDPESLPLSPSQLLTMKSKVVMPPPGVFQKNDVYCRKRWRAVQYLANVFWDRWRKEYLHSLQSRSKWNKVERNFQVNDVVLVKDEDCQRNRWPMGIVCETFPSKDNLVRSVNVRFSSGSILKRPITKLVLIVGGV